MNTILDTYAQSHLRSKALFAKAQTLIPGGVTHDSRFFRPFPVYMERAAGCRKRDADGNAYIGYVMGHGSLILGHGHPEIVKAVQEQARLGTHLGGSTQLEVRWAEAVQRLVPSMERLRFHASGTEASLMAFRLARGFTGRPKLLRFADHFHGWHDSAMPGAEVHFRPGIPAQVEETVVVLESEDIQAVARTLETDREIAAVVLEPTGARGGALPLAPDFLRTLRELTAAHGVLLIFDEVITGFRVAAGGAQERFGVTPDLTILAKILAGGYCGGAVGGRKEIMDLLAFSDDPARDAGRKIPHPGTFNANPVSAAAGSRCLEIIAAEPVNRQVEAASEKLIAGLNTVFQRNGVTALAYGGMGLAWVAFGVDGPCPSRAERMRAFASETTKLFRLALLNEGVDAMRGCWFVLSAAHSDADIDETVSKVDAAVRNMRREGAV